MEIKYYEDKYLESLNMLLEEAFQVSKTYKGTGEDLELIMVNYEQVIGYLNLNKCVNLVTGQKYFYVNYVCVKEEFKGQGVATSLFQRVFEICKELEISYLELTSNPKRVAAWNLYKKLGFVIRETAVFRKELD